MALIEKENSTEAVEEVCENPLTFFMYALKAPETRRQWPRRLKIFLDYLNMEGDRSIEEALQLVNIARQNPSWLQESLFRFMALQCERVRRGEISGSTIPNYYKAVKLFCEMNDIVLNWKKILCGLPRSKQAANVRKDGSKQENIIAVTTNECCEKHKELTGVGINAKAYKPKYIDKWINASLIEEEKSNIDNKQHIYYPLADLSDDDIATNQSQTQKTESKSKCMSFLISTISGLGHQDNILQHSKIIVPKNFEGIPERWLELYIWGLLQYPDADETFEIVNKNGQKVCLFRFMENYLEDNRSLSGYVSNAVFLNNDKEISNQLKYLEDFDRKRCKTLSISCNLDMMDITLSLPDKVKS